MTWRTVITMVTPPATPTVFDITEGDQFDDEVTVLSGLRFGWSIPNKIIWPTQPDLQVATFEINVPSFVSLGTAARGDDVTIEVQADTSGPVVARFDGKVTDYKATVRPGRPGVYLSVAAVENTGELAELVGSPYNPDFVFAGMGHQVALNSVWNDADVQPARDLTNEYLYTSAGAIGSMTTGEKVKFLDFTKWIFDQDINLTNDTRMILAPLVDPSTPRSYTIDTIECSPDRLDGVALDDTFKVLRDDFTWITSKAMPPGLVVVESSNSGDNGYTGTESSSQGGAEQYYPPRENLAVNMYTGDLLLDVVAFYEAHTADMWQPGPFTIPVTRADIGSSIPTGLFPDWSLDEGDTDRAQCYARPISLTDIDTTLTPDESDTITGQLTGAEVNIESGDMSLTLTIRRRTIEE